MANYIKIPLSLNPGRPLIVATGSLTASITTNSADATTLSATAKDFTTSGNGTSGVVALTVTVASVTTAGDGYKKGDTLTFDKSVIGGTTDVVFTLVDDDLATFEGSETNEYQLIPIDNILFVEPVNATSLQIVTNIWDASASKPLGWTVTMSTVPATDQYNLVADLCDALNKASQAENSIPVVSFFNGAVVEDVDYSALTLA